MRFSTVLSTALLVGVAAALPAPSNDYSSSSYSSSSSSDCSSGDCSSSSQSSNYCSGSSCDSSSSSSSSYGCSGSSCDSSSSSMMYSSSSTMMYDSTSTYMASSTMMYDSTSTYMATSTSSAYMTYSTSSMMDTNTADATSTAMTSTMTYGSGSSNWGGSGYNDCVQQCIASYGAPPSTYTPASSYSSDGSYQGSTGTGVTHTVIVAPTQGVFRYMPFAVNASVGDTVLFSWGANNHTVTKSSQLEICNKTKDAPFASGEQNKPFVFTQVVNDTQPTFFYCGTPTHCEKGMFGVINPPSDFQGPGSASQMMAQATSNSSDMAAMMAYTNSLTKGSLAATTWGDNIDVSQFPDWAQSLALENIMYTRAVMGANPDIVAADGSVQINDSPLVLPTDMASVNAAVDGASSSAASSSTTPTGGADAASSAPAAASSTAAAKDNGAASTVASSALLGVAAFAAAVLAF